MAKSVIAEGAEPDGPMSQINVTSLVDVMFCLLIMFMVATPLMTPEAIDVALPAGRGKEISEDDFHNSVIAVDAKGQAFLGTLPLSADPAKMADELGANPKLKEASMVFLQGDQTVPYARIVDVLVALRKAEIEEVGFVTDPNPRRRGEGG